MPKSTEIVGPDHFVWNDRQSGIEQVLSHVSSFSKGEGKHRVDPSRLVVGGMSAGGGLALDLALTGVLPVLGFIGVVPYLPDLDELREHMSHRPPRGLRGYFIIGAEDARAFETAREVTEIMKVYDLAVETEVHPGVGHDYPPRFDESLERALAFILGDSV